MKFKIVTSFRALIHKECNNISYDRPYEVYVKRNWQYCWQLVSSFEDEEQAEKAILAMMKAEENRAVPPFKRINPKETKQDAGEKED